MMVAKDLSNITAVDNFPIVVSATLPVSIHYSYTYNAESGAHEIDQTHTKSSQLVVIKNCKYIRSFVSKVVVANKPSNDLIGLLCRDQPNTK